MYWPVYWRNKTNRGRVVYTRKKNAFTWKDVRRVFTKVALDQLPEEEETFRKYIEDFSITMLQVNMAAWHTVRGMMLNRNMTPARADHIYEVMRDGLIEYLHIMEQFPAHKLQELWDWVLENAIEAVSGMLGAKPAELAPALEGPVVVDRITADVKRKILKGRQ